MSRPSPRGILPPAHEDRRAPRGAAVALQGFIALMALAFAVSAAIMAVRAIGAPGTLGPDAAAGQETRSALLIHVVQALTGLILCLLPSWLDRHTRLRLPLITRALFVVFLMMALLIGSVWNNYDLIPHWDKVQHAYSATLLTLLGAGLMLTHEPTGKGGLPRARALRGAVAGLCFAETIGVFWEFFEFSVDSLLDLNSQRFAAPDGTPLIGQAALYDTMGDLLTNTLGAVAMALILYLLMRRNADWLGRLIPRITPRREGAADA